jgi:hypothetical protein
VISLGRISVRVLINMVLEMVLSLGDLQGRNAVFPKFKHVWRKPQALIISFSLRISSSASTL